MVVTEKDVSILKKLVLQDIRIIGQHLFGETSINVGAIEAIFHDHFNIIISLLGDDLVSSSVNTGSGRLRPAKPAFNINFIQMVTMDVSC